MLLIDILKDDSFKESQILAGQSALNNEINSVMILEASDIEHWGAPNQLILSSYFALADLDQEGLEAFFIKMKEIGSSGLIIKPQRLIDEVPKHLINLSNKYAIPLILIDPSVKYEKIVLAVLQPIINQNTAILNAYYDYRRMLSELSLKDYTLLETLNQFKSILHSDLQLELLGDEFVVSTLPHKLNYKEDLTQLIERSKFVARDYLKRSLTYTNRTSQDILSVYIPNIDNKPYLLSIFKSPLDITQIEYMFIENAVEYLQNYLLTDYSLKKDQFVHRNNQMLELLFNPNIGISETNRILEHLNINQFNDYQQVLISIKRSDCHNSEEMEKLVAYARSIWPHVAFLQKNEDILFVFNLDQNKQISEIDFNDLLEDSCIYHIAISDKYQSDFYSHTKTIEKMSHFMGIVYHDSTIIEYSKLGFFKFFLDVQSIDELLQYVPSQILDLIKQKPELAQTLETFLDQNQNFVKTGEILYIHPKTVRYRIERLSELLNLDFNNANDLLTTHIALKVCSYAKLHN